MAMNHENKKIAIKSKDLAAIIMVLLFVIFVLFALARAWMTAGGDTSAHNMTIGVRPLSSIDFELYMWDDVNGVWKTVPEETLNFKNVVPNELRRYKIVADSAFSTARFAFDDLTDLTDILPFIYIRQVTQTEDEAAIAAQEIPITFGLNTVVGATNDFETLLNATSSFAFTNTGSTTTCIFDIYLHKDVCNCFALYDLSGTLELNTD